MPVGYSYPELVLITPTGEDLDDAVYVATMYTGREIEIFVIRYTTLSTLLYTK